MTWIIYVENTKELTTTKNLLKLINNYDKVGNIRLIDKGQLLSYLPATGLLVFSSTCKEIGSQPFVLKTSKKLNRWKTQQLSLDHKRREDTGQAIASKTGEIYRWIHRITITIHHRNHCQVGKLDLRLKNCRRLSVDNLRVKILRENQL